MMMNNEKTLLAQMLSDWQRLVQALEGVPHTALETARLPDGRTLKDACALLTVWDGEMIRRVKFVTGNGPQPSQPVHNTQYWQAWSQKQVDIKRIMSFKGLMVDMIATRQRLFAQLADLNEFYMARWLDFDPQATASLYLETVAAIEAWRLVWDNAHLPTHGLSNLWQSFKDKYLKK